MPASLAAWVGCRVDRMDKDALVEAVKHYRDSGHRSFGEFRHYATSGVDLRRRGGNDVSGWDCDELRGLLINQLGPVFPH